MRGFAVLLLPAPACVVSDRAGLIRAWEASMRGHGVLAARGGTPSVRQVTWAQVD